VQSNDPEHAVGRFPDGDESHGVLRIVVNKFFNQLVPDFAHRHEKSQTQIFRGHFTEEIRIEHGVLRLERADEDLFSIAQSNVAFEQGRPPAPAKVFFSATSAPEPSLIPADQV
jgi:hypothetical protein